MINIQISTASDAKDDVASMFVLQSQTPPAMQAKYNSGWVLMVGHRELLGDLTSSGENVFGRHWVAIDRKNPYYGAIIESNRKLNGRVVIPISKHLLNQIAMLNNKYKDQYMELDTEEQYKLLEGRIRKLEGLPYSQLKHKMDEVR